MKKLLLVLLHVIGYPALIALVLYFNWDVITSQASNYGIFVFVGLAVTVVMAIIYYICYAAITAKKKKKRKTIFNQTVRLCMVVVICTTGLWAVCDIALPDFLANATSSTIFYEDLVDGWDDRADVNEDLLNKFIDTSVKAGTLPYDSTVMTQDEAIAYYQSKGYNESIAELEGVEHYGTIAGLFAIQYQSINANGYQSFTHPGIDFATSDRLTIPCLIHLLLDEREINQSAISNYDYTAVVTNEDGTTEVTSVFFAVCDKETGTITLEHVNWTVLDMLGTDTVLEIGDIPGLIDGLMSGMGGTVGVLMKSDLGPIFTDLLVSLSKIVASEDIVGSELNVILSTGPGVTDGAISIALRPTTGYFDASELEKTTFYRGVLGYQEMAWLDSNGLIYALVTLFSTRKIFLIFGAWGVVINLLIGVVRGMCKEEKNKKKRLEQIQAPEKPQRMPTYGAMR